MDSVTFGRRGLPPQGSELTRSVRTASTAQMLDDTGEASLSARIPYLTFGLLFLLTVIFGVECRFAFDIGKDGALSVDSILAFGAVSRDLVGSGEYWRLFLAPLLHGSNIHLLGNGLALALAGFKLEPLVGRGWFAALFVLGAFGGEVGSITGNSPGVLTVGASGAITALLAAVFTLSFHHRAVDDGAKMRAIALRFGVPALLPLAFGATGAVDYYAHLGGAITGIVSAGLLPAVWPEDRFRPMFAKAAAAVSAAALMVSFVCVGIAARAYPDRARVAAQFIPSSEIPATSAVGAARSADFLARFPQDPRSHLYRVVFLMGARDLPAAEREARSTLAMLPSTQGERFSELRLIATGVLATVLAAQQRWLEARDVARELCLKGEKSVKTGLAKLKLCR